MHSLLDKIPYSVLIVITILMLMAPVRPMPHVAEKLLLLLNGELYRPVDIFDLLFHMAPLLVTLLKFGLDRRRRRTFGHRT